MLSIRALAKRYAGPATRVVLEGVDLDLAAGDYVAIMGESGAGKSTLLNLVAGLDRPDGGSVAIGGTDLATLDDDALTILRRERLGFVFQAFHVLPYLTVAQNVGLPLALHGHRRAARDRGACRRCSRRSDSPIARGPCRASSPAARCSAWRSRARWSTGRCWCSPTSRPAISIPTARPASSRCCATRSRRAARPASSSRIRMAAARTADRILVLSRGGLRERVPA